MPLKIPRGIASVGANSVQCLTAQRMEVHGHRGMNGYPDNTLASFKAAFEAGVDVVELDLQVTDDNHLLVAHDAIPNVGTERCGIDHKSLLKAALRDLDFSTEQKVRCGIKKFDEDKLEPIPELKQVFAEFKDLKTTSGKPARLNIEVKYFMDQIQFYPPENEYIDLIIKVIGESGWATDRFFVQSFNAEFLKKFKAKAPDIEVVPLVGDARAAEKIALELGAKKVTPGFWHVNPELVFKLQKQGIKVIVWTPNLEGEIRQVIESGADGIITDYPELFYKIRNELCGL
ncbi:glycerophosphodiester phosphodiesterase family protein [Bdellovibrio sp. HCB185ZH]|uniref:glycerophosphodiester phosphodiesterase family protein n=1 Tax=Bdellovibrio sp. HCB185ZH TaxID=3394235 RepID=UPI0039A4EDB6